MTEPGKTYNIKSTETGRWLSTRKSGGLYMGEFQARANSYDGGPDLDSRLYGEFVAVEE